MCDDTHLAGFSHFDAEPVIRPELLGHALSLGCVTALAVLLLHVGSDTAHSTGPAVPFKVDFPLKHELAMLHTPSDCKHQSAKGKTFT